MNGLTSSMPYMAVVVDTIIVHLGLKIEVRCRNQPNKTMLVLH